MSPNAESEFDLSPEELLEIERLEAEIAGFKAEQTEAVATIRRLMDEERPAEGLFHHEKIFRLQQDKLRLEVEMKLRSNKINRIRLGMEGVSPCEAPNGFVL